MKVKVFGKSIGTVMSADTITINGSKVSAPVERATAAIVKVLLLAANTRDTTQLAIDEEVIADDAREMEAVRRAMAHRATCRAAAAEIARPEFPAGGLPRDRFRGTVGCRSARSS